MSGLVEEILGGCSEVVEPVAGGIRGYFLRETFCLLPSKLLQFVRSLRSDTKWHALMLAELDEYCR